MYLNVLQPGASRDLPLFVSSSAPVTYGDGFYDEEREQGRAFRWMSARGSLTFDADARPRFLELWILSEFRELAQRIDVTSEGSRETLPLTHGWSPLSIDVPPGATVVSLHASPLFPSTLHPGDSRSLSVRLRDVRLHGDPERHRAVRRQYENAVRNLREMLEGRTQLTSTPTSVGIDLHGACNVKPPCVYCEWDYSKDLEGDHVDVPFTPETLKEWGAFFDNAIQLVNCSIGEPFMMRTLDELLDIFGNTGKVLEMTTNGQILTERNIQKLLGRPIDLYISLDAATPLTYSRLRNDTFDKILGNIRRLVQAKGGRGGFPRVSLVFMPMRCNVDELERFVRLCAELQVDRLVLRPLNYSPAAGLESERGGYRFVYQDELLPFGEVVRASARAARLARMLGVELSDQMDFGGSLTELFADDVEPATVSADDANSAPRASPPAGVADCDPPTASVPASAPFAEGTEQSGQPVPAEGDTSALGGSRGPACLEPWKSLYILRRGVMPCCYGAAPIAPMEQYRAAWNSREMQAIRGALLDGRFHDYCLKSTSCPIVRKADRSAALPWRQRAILKAREYFARANRRLGGVPVRIWVTVKQTVASRQHATAQPTVRH